MINQGSYKACNFCDVLKMRYESSIERHRETGSREEFSIAMICDTIRRNGRPDGRLTDY